MALFRNHYECSDCANYWNDMWSCMCNDKCGICNAEIEPHQSDELLRDYEVTTPKFDATDDKTDHHVLWVSARNFTQVHTALGTLGYGPVFNVVDLTLCPDSEDIDFILPRDADAFRSHIQHLMKDRS